MRKKKKPFLKQIRYEIKKSRGIGSGSLFIVVIFIAMSVFGFAMAGGGVPSIRSTQPPKENPPAAATQQTNPHVVNPSEQPHEGDASISSYPEPTRKIIYLP